MTTTEMKVQHLKNTWRETLDIIDQDWVCTYLFFAFYYNDDNGNESTTLEKHLAGNTWESTPYLRFSFLKYFK